MNTLIKGALLAGGMGFLATGMWGAAPLRPAVARQAVRHAVAKRLQLTDEQKAAIKAEREKVAAEVKSIRADKSLTRPEKVAKAKEAVKQGREEIKGKLTDAQKKKVKAAKAKLHPKQKQ